MDDDEPSRLIARRALEPLGQRLVLAETGEEALECAAREDFAVILLDIGLPGTDGLGVAQHLRRQERSRHTPLIFVTGRLYTDALLATAYATGASDLLFKPFSAEVVRTKVRVFVDLYLQRQHLEVQHSELLARTEALDRARADQAETETTLRELRRAHELARMHEERYRLAIQATNDIVWDWDLLTQEVRWNDALHTVLGHDVPLNEGGLRVTQAAWWISQIHPEDRDRVETSLHGTVQGTNNAWVCTYRIQRGDGSFLDVQDRGFVARDTTGRPQRMVGAMMDATERRRTEAEYERLNAIFAQAPVAIAILRGPHHIIELANATVCRIWGRRQEEVLGKPHFEVLPESAGQGFEELLAGVLTTGVPYVGREQPARLARLEGGAVEQAYFNFVYEPMRDAQGRIEGVIIVSSDVTEQVRARQRIEGIQAELEATFEGIPDAAYVGDLTGIKRANRKALEMLGYKDVAQLHVPVAELSEQVRVRWADTGEPVPLEQMGLVRALGGDAEAKDYIVYNATTGRDIVVRSAASPVRLNGQVIAAVVVNTDITERREAEEALRRSEEEFRSLAESLPQVVWTAAPDGSVTYVNSVMTRYTGLGADVLRGAGYRKIVHPEDLRGSLDRWLASLKTGEPFETEDRWRRHDGAWRWHLVRALPLRDASGKVLKWLGTGTDVHDLRQYQLELQRRVDFEQQLIGIVSHDLRNPLSAILLGVTALARREGLDDRSLQATLRIRSSAERATRMIRDLLDFTQARLGGGIRIERRSADLHQVTQSVLEEIRTTIPDREVELRCTGDGKGTWDADRLAQVVQNLVTNALKYSPADTLVRVETRGEEAQVVLSVHNLGTPLSPERREHLFEPLQRAAHEVDKAGRSVGLGLYIVDQLVRAHEGKVSVDSTEAEGTTFTVKLPRHTATAAR